MNQLTAVRQNNIKARGGPSGAETVLVHEDNITAAPRALDDLRKRHYLAKKAAAGISGPEAAQTYAAMLPSLAEIGALHDQLAQSLSTAPSDRVNLVLVGLLIDAFPNARISRPETFVQVLVHDLTEAGHPPVVIALALKALRRSPVEFFPPIGQILAACDKEAEQALMWVVAVERVAHEKRHALEFVAQ